MFNLRFGFGQGRGGVGLSSSPLSPSPSFSSSIGPPFFHLRRHRRSPPFSFGHRITFILNTAIPPLPTTRDTIQTDQAINGRKEREGATRRGLLIGMRFFTRLDPLSSCNRTRTLTEYSSQRVDATFAGH